MDTLIVDEDLCTKCRICSEVCAPGIIKPEGEEMFPCVPDEYS
jgi:NAD-dependent dihydropyrimidine dehydrogenase PreA subunit